MQSYFQLLKGFANWTSESVPSQKCLAEKCASYFNKSGKFMQTDMKGRIIIGVGPFDSFIYSQWWQGAIGFVVKPSLSDAFILQY